jgi:hypothetical protein
MRWVMLSVVAVVAAALGGAMMGGSPAQAAKPEKVLRHIVLYQFKDGTTPAQLQEVIDAFARLPKQIDAIIDFEHGANVSNEGKSDGLTHAFVVTFRDERGRETYLKHPAHDEYVKVVRDKRENVVVFDYWVAE